jgi:hypothetical protein
MTRSLTYSIPSFIPKQQANPSVVRSVCGLPADGM